MTAYPQAMTSLDVTYPDHPLNRLTTFFRLFCVIPIAIVYGFLAGTGIGVIFVPAMLMLLFRRKYPRWWFDFNRELIRFYMRISIYMGLLTDRYPSTDEQQDLALELPTPDGAQLNRWLPLVKWLLAIPHYIVLAVLYIGALIAVVIAWFAILFTGRYPRALFDYVVGVDALAGAGDRLRVRAGDRRVPAVQAARVTGWAGAAGYSDDASTAWARTATWVTAG